MPGLDPGIHVFLADPLLRRGCPGHLARRRALRFCQGMTSFLADGFSTADVPAQATGLSLPPPCGGGLGWWVATNDDVAVLHRHARHLHRPRGTPPDP